SVAVWVMIAVTAVRSTPPRDPENQKTKPKAAATTQIVNRPIRAYLARVSIRFLHEFGPLLAVAGGTAAFAMEIGSEPRVVGSEHRGDRAIADHLAFAERNDAV